MKWYFRWFSSNSHRLNYYGVESPLLCLGLLSFEYNWWILKDLLFNRFRLNKFLFAKFVIFINGLKFDTREWISRFRFQNREKIFGNVPNTNKLLKKFPTFSYLSKLLINRKKNFILWKNIWIKIYSFIHLQYMWKWVDSLNCRRDWWGLTVSPTA